MIWTTNLPNGSPGGQNKGKLPSLGVLAKAPQNLALTSLLPSFKVLPNMMLEVLIWLNNISHRTNLAVSQTLALLALLNGWFGIYTPSNMRVHTYTHTTPHTQIWGWRKIQFMFFLFCPMFEILQKSQQEYPVLYIRKPRMETPGILLYSKTKWRFLFS